MEKWIRCSVTNTFYQQVELTEEEFKKINEYLEHDDCAQEFVMKEGKYKTNDVYNLLCNKLDFDEPLESGDIEDIELLDE